MTPSSIHRLAPALALSAVVAVLAAPALALGGSNPGATAPDWFERYASAHPYGVGVVNNAYAPDWFERYAGSRYAASHPYGINDTIRVPSVLADGRSPDTLAAAEVARVQLDGRRSPKVPSVLADGRSPDTLAAAEGARVRLDGGRSPDTIDPAIGASPTETADPARFQWDDAVIGAIATAILLALAGISVLLFTRLHRRGDVQAI